MQCKYKSCKLEAVDGRVQCQYHLDKANIRVKKYQDKKKALGLCPNDGKVLAEGCKFCRHCLDVAWERTQPRKKEIKKKAVEILGRKCLDCGYSSPEFPEVFDFHHLDAEIKDDKISSLIARGRSWEDIEAEVLKCVLLCSNCHRIRHAKESQ